MMMKRSGMHTLIVTILVALLGSVAWAFQPPQGPRRPLEDFDIRLQAPSFARPALTAGQRQALTRLSNQVRGVQLQWHRLYGTPRHILSYQQPLTPPSRDTAINIARQFLQEFRALYKLSEADLASLVLRKHYTTQHNGMRHVIWQQVHQGLEVFLGEIRCHINSNGQVISVSSEYAPGIDLDVVPTRSASEALLIAAHQIDPALDFTPVLKEISPTPARTTVFAKGPFAEEITASLTIFPLRDRAVLAWKVLLQESGIGNLYEIVVAAEGDGVVLHRRNFTRYLVDGCVSNGTLADPQGCVFHEESPQPPDGTLSPPVVDRMSLAFDGADNGFLPGDPHFDWWNSSPVPWSRPKCITSQSNNVDAKDDQAADNEITTGIRAADPRCNYAFPLELETPAQPPENFVEAAVTNLFYWNNWFHDYLYQLGFDEASGNFQEDNFGLGGLGSDSVFADAQDGAGLNNANFSTPPDGSNPRMQMFLFTTATPFIDGDYAQEVVLHEYTHGLSWRLVGNVAGVQAGAMGEGWSDWFPLSIFNQPPDDPEGPEVSGEYPTQDFLNGIRRFPTATDITINPLTYGDLCQGPRGCEVHDNGEIWTVALWEARANLIDVYGYTAGRQLIEQLVVDGMKLTPPGPSMLDARNGILLADVINNGGANICQLLEAFAKRGMGASACSGVGCSPGDTGGSGDRTVTEAFDLLPACVTISPFAR